MPIKTLKDFLDQQAVRYTSGHHSPAYTAQELAQALHTSGKQVAKTVILALDGKLAMVVMPACYRIRWDRFIRAMGTDFVELADEDEFQDRFPECEVGAMPPFGNLYGMNVYLCDALTRNQEICFPAGTHHEIIQMAYADYSRLVRPVVLSEGFIDPSTASRAARRCIQREPLFPGEWPRRTGS